MNASAKQHLIKSLDQNIRMDGRKKDEFRKITVETGFIKTAEGSARVKIGGTEVIAGVKMAVGTPYPDTPDEGTMSVGAELLPLSNPEFESGPPSTKSIELARVIDRGIRESKAIDVKKLCITPGEKAWMINVDICPINDEGNLFDAGAIATMLAIADTKLPKYEEGKVNYKEPTKQKLPIKIVPTSVTVWKIGDHYLIDPLTDEEEMMDARLSVASTPDGKLCALQKGGDTPLTPEQIKEMINLGIQKASEVRAHLR